MRRERIREERESEKDQLRKEKEEKQERAAKEWEVKLEQLRLQTDQLNKADEKDREMRDFMYRQEEVRRQHKKELLEKQIEIEKLRTEENRRNHRAEKMEPWRDTDKPEAYFSKFERVMKEAAIPTNEWASRLIPLLTGKALTAYSSHVASSATKDYSALKAAMLEATWVSQSLTAEGHSGTISGRPRTHLRK